MLNSLMEFMGLGLYETIVASGGGIAWLLNDSFTDTLTAGNVNGTAATPGPGTRVVVDTDGDGASVGSGVLAVDNPNSGWGDPGIWWDAVTRASGIIEVFQVTLPDTTGTGAIGFSDAQNGEADIHAIDFNNADLRAKEAAAVVVVGAVAATSYYFAIVLRTAGAYYFVKGGAFSDWTLIWVASSESTGTIYPNINTYDQTITNALIRVPEDLWLPTPLIYDTFTDTNGVSLDAHTSNTTGPDSQDVTGRAWNENGGNWEINSNRARNAGATSNPTFDSGESDILLDCVMNVGTATSVTMSIVVRYTDDDELWFVGINAGGDELRMYERTGASTTIRASGAATINASTDYDVRTMAYDETIDAFVDGANKITYGSAASNKTATKQGMRTSSSAQTYDNLTVFARDDGYSDLDNYIN